MDELVIGGMFDFDMLHIQFTPLFDSALANLPLRARRTCTHGEPYQQGERAAKTPRLSTASKRSIRTERLLSCVHILWLVRGDLINHFPIWSMTIFYSAIASMARIYWLSYWVCITGCRAPIIRRRGVNGIAIYPCTGCQGDGSPWSQQWLAGIIYSFIHCGDASTTASFCYRCWDRSPCYKSHPFLFRFGFTSPYR